MRETEKRIREYQAQLPRVRERVIAAFMIFAISVAMVTMSAFAWVTLSVSPEVVSVKTTIAANGNLEIALAYNVLTEVDEEGNVVPVRDSNNNLIPLLPNSSAIGDSLLPVRERNLTWGNLINLTDSSYGLDKIVLRPAMLNEDPAMIKTRPFQSVTYGIDGRVLATNDNYRPTQWQIIDAANNVGAFVDSDYFGVKAISSVDILETEVDSALEAEYLYGRNRVATAFQKAKDYFIGDFAAMMESSDSHTSAIAGLLTTYMNGTLYNNLEKAGGPDNVLIHCETTDIQSLLELMNKLDENVIDEAMLGVMELFDLYRMDTYVDKAAYDADPEGYKKNHMPFTPLKGKEDLDMFYANAKTMLAEMNTARVAQGMTKLDDTNFKTLTQILSFKKTITNCITDVEARLATGETIYWKDIKGTVNTLVNISTCTINGDTMTTLFSSIKNNISKLSSMLGNSADKNNAVIHGGLIRDLDAFLHSGTGIRVNRVAVSVTYEAMEYRLGDNAWMMGLIGMKEGESKVVQANVTTDGDEDVNPSVTTTDRISAFGDQSQSQEGLLKAGYVKETIAALDTYGLSIDFWIRSNEANAYLILEGEVQTEEIPSKKSVTVDGVAKEVEYYEVVITTTKTEIDPNTQQPISGKEPEVTEQTTEAYKGSDGKWYATADSALLEWEADSQEGTAMYHVQQAVTKDTQKMDTIVTGYNGVNRIWDEKDLYVEEAEYSTSQGSGSCYTFYADPSEAETILNVLKKMYVVFVDASGTIRAKAKLDTDLCYSQNGKHVVPLVIFEGTTLEIPLYTDDGTSSEGDSGAATVAEEGETTDTGTEGGTDGGTEDGTEGEGGETDTEPSIPTETVQTIMYLPKNEATLLTALIYLEGDKLYNKDVLSSSEIDGQFNIQFGTMERPQPIDDEKLQSEQLVITGSVAKGTGVTNEDSFGNTVEFAGTEPSYDITLKLTTTGSQPKTMEAFFLRRISETQGTRMEKVKLNCIDEENGIWTANLSFESAGTYILRDVEADGIERPLTEMLTVSIPGFTVSNFKSDTLTNNPSTYQYLTSADMVKESFSMKMGADGKNNMPSNVRAIFSSEDGINVAVTFRPSGDDELIWRGDATFSTSGTYTMQYLLLDDEFYDLQTVYTRKVSLGLKASVVLTKTDDFAENEEFRRNDTDTGYQYIFRGTPHTFAATVRIYDNAGAEVRGLAGVKLYYTEENTDLIWNPGAGVYGGGHLPIDSPGVYEFRFITVTNLTGGREVIEVATSADSITAVPSAPVSYTGVSTENTDTVYAVAGEDAMISISFQNAAASKVYGKFRVDMNSPVNADAAYRILSATLKESIKSADGQTSNDTYIFDIPDEDGYWSLESVLVTNVYDGATGNFYGNETLTELTVEAFDAAMDAADQKYYEITAEQIAEQNPDFEPIKVIKNVNISKGEQDLTEATGSFMEKHKVGKISVTLLDFAEMPITGIDSVNITFKHQFNTMPAYGSYTSADLRLQAQEIEAQNIQLQLTDPDKDGTYTVDSAAEIWLAGEYKPQSMSYVATVKGKTTSVSVLDEETVKYFDTIKISSTVPTVKIDSVSTNPTTARYYTTSTPSNANGMITGSYNKKLSDYNALVYMYVAAQSGSLDQEQVSIKYPSVTLALSGVPTSHQGATMTFPSGNNGTTSFVFTAGGSKATANIGAGTDGVFNEGILGLGSGVDTWPIFYPAGKQTVSQIKITYDGIDYTVTLSDAVTINNPLYPAYADFKIDDSRYTGTVPSRVYSTNAETIILPDIDNWTNYNVSTALGDKAYPDPTASSAGTYYYDRGWWRYYTYSRTEYTQSCTVNSQIDNITYKLQWKVGNTLYDPGTEIAASGAINVTAVITEVSREYVKTESVTYTKTWYTYTQTGTSKSGKEISFTPNASTKYDASNNVYDESEVTS